MSEAKTVLAAIDTAAGTLTGSFLAAYAAIQNGPAVGTMTEESATAAWQDAVKLARVSQASLDKVAALVSKVRTMKESGFFSGEEWETVYLAAENLASKAKDAKAGNGAPTAGIDIDDSRREWHRAVSWAAFWGITPTPSGKEFNRDAKKRNPSLLELAAAMNHTTDTEQELAIRRAMSGKALAMSGPKN